MAQIYIQVNFNSARKTHSSLVSELSNAFQAQKGDTVDFQIHLDNKSRIVYSDLLILVTSTLLYLRQSQIKVTGLIHYNEGDSKTNYASRVNFFRILDLNVPEYFIRKNTKDRFTEIESYDKSNMYNVYNKLMKVIIINMASKIKQEVRLMLYFCLSEIMDNVINHSQLSKKYKGSGWCCAQLFPKKKAIRMMICDTGIGIHQALTSPIESKFKHLTEKEALSRCLERGVTNGKGLGFGLFATSEFIRLNKGEMILYSGNTFVSIINGKITIKNGNYWQGTFVYLKINIDIAVDYKQLMPATYSLSDEYSNYVDNLLGISEDLW